MNMQEVMLMMVMVVAVMQLEVSMVQTRHLTTSSSTAAPLISLRAPAQAPVSPPVVATPALGPSRPSTSRSSGGGPVTYIVGDSFGWTVPISGGATTYSTWASDKTFNAGDILMFNFANHAHSVAEVTRTAFDSCQTTTTAYSHISTSPARITLTHPGPLYFICTLPQHCTLGQKLAINVTGSSATLPPSPSINAAGTPPAPSTSTTTPSAPSSPPDVINYAPPAAPSSAPPSMMAALPVALLSILTLAAFFC